jgi:hypothetical protein
MFLGTANLMALSGRLHLETGSPKFKMAAVKREVPSSQLLYKIAKNSNCYLHVFGVREHINAVGKSLYRKPKSDIQDGGCQTGSTCISASIQDSKEIPQANPMFS